MRKFTGQKMKRHPVSKVILPERGMNLYPGANLIIPLKIRGGCHFIHRQEQGLCVVGPCDFPVTKPVTFEEIKKVKNMDSIFQGLSGDCH